MSKQILVVDDEPNVRLTYRVTLETEGFTVLEANSGPKALEQFAAHPIDLAILDMRMPEMDGLDLLAEMRKRGNNTPTVIITAYGDVPHAVRAMKLGAIDFLKKPVTPDQLRQIAGEVIGRHEAPQPAPSDVEASIALSAEELHALYLQDAKRLLNLQHFDQARVKLAKAMALDPLSAEAFNLAGVLFEMQEDYERAKKYYSQAIKLDKHFESAQQNMRRVFELSNFGASTEPFTTEDNP
jgi:DNA-binding response OmpR family regulator